LNDKPSIAVSQHPNTAGTVYAAYLRNPINDNMQPQAIGFAMLDNVTQPNPGQWKVRTDVPIPNPGQVQCPIVVVDQTSSESLGSVYVIYLDWAHDGIYIYRTSDKGASWSLSAYLNLSTANTLIHLAGASDARICFNRGASQCVLAASMISARYEWHSLPDASRGSIGMVFNAWDGLDVNTAKMHSYFVRFNPLHCDGLNPCGPAFDKGPVVLTDASLDSWNPNLDYDSVGNYIASWYRRTDNSTLLYRTEFAALGSDGTLNHMIACPSCPVGDITRYTLVAGYSYQLGEYKEIWYTSYLGFAAGSTVDIASSYGNIASYNVVP
jgi:hypothetical protein